MRPFLFGQGLTLLVEVLDRSCNIKVWKSASLSFAAHMPVFHINSRASAYTLWQGDDIGTNEEGNAGHSALKFVTPGTFRIRVGLPEESLGVREA